MNRAYLSLGSNIGDRLLNIQHAVSMLAISDKISVIKSSSFYETEPWGVKNQNWFLNAAIAIDTVFSPIELLCATQSIERQMGRNRNNEKRWHERIIDIDILMFNDDIISIADKLVIPHPYMHKRAFVLVPMLEVKSDLIHPLYKKTISELYDVLENPEDVFLYGTVLPK